jgi:poly(3-hydroxybutyrate) depolymerase
VLYTFFHDSAPRSFGLLYPPDWFDHVEGGTLSLLVVLHGGNQDITDFEQIVRVRNLLTGAYHAGEKQKLVAIFPVGLSRDLVIGGNWAAGLVGGDADELGIDDVSFVFACIETVDQLLVREMTRQRALGRALPNVESVFVPGRRFVMGFSNGAGMVAHLLARRPGFFRAAAMHSHVFSGWKHTFLKDEGFPIEANDPAPADPGVSLLHLVGARDDRVLPVLGDTSGEGTPEGTKDIKDYIGTNSPHLPEGYFRYDEALDSSVMHWFQGSIWNPHLIAVAPFPVPPAFPLPPAFLPPYVHAANMLYEERVWKGTYVTGETAEIRQVIVAGLEHAWWFEDDDDNATKMFWDFFLTYAI